MTTKTKITNLFIDMDDVLAGFCEGFERVTGKNIKKLNDGTGWTLIGEHADKGLFYNLNPTAGYQAVAETMSKARELGASVGFLTNVGNPMLYDVGPVIRDKLKWLDKHGLGDYPMFWTTTGKGKAAFAHRHALLLDDSATNCFGFEKAGGHAIMYDDRVFRDSLGYLDLMYTFGRD